MNVGMYEYEKMLFLFAIFQLAILNSCDFLSILSIHTKILPLAHKSNNTSLFNKHDIENVPTACRILHPLIFAQTCLFSLSRIVQVN